MIDSIGLNEEDRNRLTLDSSVIRHTDLSTDEKSRLDRTVKTANTSLTAMDLSTSMPMRQDVTLSPPSRSEAVHSIATSTGIARPTAPSPHELVSGGVQDPDPAIEESIEDLELAKQRLLQESVKAAETGDKPRANYLITMSKLVADITTLLTLWNSQDSRSVEKKKRDYRGHVKTLEGAGYSKAKVNGVAAIVGIVGNLAAGYMGYQDASILLNQIGNVKGVLVEQTDAGSVNAGQLNQLLVQELARAGEGSSSNSRLEEVSRQLLGEIKQWMQRAVSAQ